MKRFETHVPPTREEALRESKLISMSEAMEKVAGNAESGKYLDEDSDGVREKHGEPAAFSGAKRFEFNVDMHDDGIGEEDEDYDPLYDNEVEAEEEEEDPGIAAHCRYLYRQTLNKKAIIFARSRNEVEQLIGSIRKIAAENKTPDYYFTHHSSISAALREEAEAFMKTGDGPAVIGATLTLELGIDLGSLDRVIQVGAPMSVSSFTQRVGRCGRRGQKSELIFTFLEPRMTFQENQLDIINWDFIKMVAIVQLYLADRWVEPVTPPTRPYSMLYHQTLCHLASTGEASAPALASNVLGLSAFKHISQEDYKTLLSYMLEMNHLQRTAEGTFIIGTDAESKVSFYDFLCVFEGSQEYTVKHDSKAIGTITGLYPEGARFSLAGRAWEVVAIPDKGRILLVKPATGRHKSAWVSPYSAVVDTVLVRKMRDILASGEQYAYLTQDCLERLRGIREVCKDTGLLEMPFIRTSKHHCSIFPWVGSRELSTLVFALQDIGVYCTIKPNEKNPVYLETDTRSSGLETYFEESNERAVEEIRKRTLDLMKTRIDRHNVKVPPEVQVSSKFNKFVPDELLVKQFVEDFLKDVEPCVN
jgi:ATP-dependent Lhr-like helicase